MNKEFLIGLGITDDEIIEAIIRQYESDTENLKNSSAALQERLDAANRQIDELGKLDYDGIRRIADEYKEKYRASVKASEKMLFDNAVDAAVNAARPKNAKAVKALINYDMLKFSEGRVIGLEEQLRTIKLENPFLFEPEDGSPRPLFSGSIGSAGSSVSYNSARSIMGLPEIE